ncbi:MAG: TerB family tellurite resistance protein [Bacteroidales bacterium]|jgi:DnaJ like chaperone protein
MGIIRWITGGLGFFFGGGFIGGVIGYAAGSLLENLINKEYQGVPRQQGDFSISLLILAAAVMKADGKIMKSELNFVKDFFTRQFGEEHTKNRLEILKELLEKDINIEEACEKIRSSLNYSSRLQLLHYLFGVAVADNSCSAVERDLIRRISQLLWLNEPDYKTIEAMYFDGTDSSYVILQIEKTASDDEIKKAYRKMAIKYHPDKVEALGEGAKKAAKEKFQEINNAYEKIKKERNII